MSSRQKRTAPYRIAIVVTASIIIAFGLFQGLSRAQESTPAPDDIPPIPGIDFTYEPDPDYKATATPTRDPNFTPSTNEYVSLENQVTKSIDLSPDLETHQEYFIYVRTINGDVIFYTVGPFLVGEYDLRTLPDEIIAKLPLAPTDVILSAEPPSPMRRDIPIPQHVLTPQSSITPLPAISPYP